jgi:hypothetical protein
MEKAKLHFEPSAEPEHAESDEVPVHKAAAPSGDSSDQAA